MSNADHPLHRRDEQERHAELYEMALVPDYLFDGDWNTAYGELEYSTVMVRNIFTVRECQIPVYWEDELR